MDVKQSSVEALRRITRALDVHSRALLQKHSLTGPQLSVLKELARQGQAPIGTLAKSTYLGAPTVTGVVDRLERQGWVTRVPGKEDRRQVLISISAAGRRMLAQSTVDYGNVLPKIAPLPASRAAANRRGPAEGRRHDRTIGAQRRATPRSAGRQQIGLDGSQEPLARKQYLGCVGTNWWRRVGDLVPIEAGQWTHAHGSATSGGIGQKIGLEK